MSHSIDYIGEAKPEISEKELAKAVISWFQHAGDRLKAEQTTKKSNTK